MGKGAFQSWEEVQALVAKFETQALRGENDWTHRDHLATAAYYCIDCPPLAEKMMREGIKKLNAARGVAQTPDGGYHETLTVVWTRLIAAYIDSQKYADHLDQVNSVLNKFEDKKAPLDYYSRDRLLSQEARYGWVEPDLRQLPGRSGPD